MAALSDLFIGVQTQDLPTITTAGVTPSPINIGGLLIDAERGTNKVHRLTSATQIYSIFGRYRSGHYGHYCMAGFFSNLQGESGVLYAKRMIPDDAVASSIDISNGSEDTWTLEAGRLGLVDKGVWGNQLWVNVTASSRGSTGLAVALSGDETVITVDSVAPFAIGDWIDIDDSSNDHQGRISKIDESTNQLTLLDANPSANAIADTATVSVVDRTIEVYLKDSDTGNVELVETIPNVTIAPESAEFYFVNVINDEFTGSRYLYATDNSVTADDTYADFPTATATGFANASQLTSGADGGSLSTTEMAAELDSFDDYPIRYLSNTEAFSEAVWDDGELYCKTRGDAVWVGTPTENMTFAEALIWANGRRKSRKVYAWNNVNWLEVDDPIGNGSLPVKNVPNVGHFMAHSIYVTTLRGIHKVPASTQQTVVGIRGIVGEFTSRPQIRDLANAGLNAISDLTGSFGIRSARTPSKLPEWRFVNAVNMSIFFKKSYEDSFRDLENEPNQAVLIQRMREAMIAFALQFYLSSSNGGAESGFHSFQKSNGAVSGFEDVVQVVTDDSVNPIRDINAGVLKANFYFMPPPPAERILVGVGLLFLQ